MSTRAQIQRWQWLALTLLSVTKLQAVDDPPGAIVFRQNCAVCHENARPGARIPDMAGLKTRTPAQIVQALDSGVMQAQGARLTATERTAVAAWLGLAPAAPTVSERSNQCAAEPGWSPRGTGAKWESWGGGPENWRFQKAGGLAAADIPKLKLKWAFAIPDATAMRSQPVVLEGRVFVGGTDGSVYSLDARTGCSHWISKIPAQVRSGLAIAQTANTTLVLAGDVAGNVTALDAGTGARIWSRKVDDSPFAMVTSTPLVHNGRIYLGVASREEPEAAKPGYVCCTFRGSVLALNPADGAVIWKTWTTSEPPTPRARSKRGVDVLGPSGAGIWATPTFDVERNLLYVTTGDNYSDPTTDTSDALLALDPKDGRLVWSKQFTKGDAFNTTCVSPTKANCPDSEGPDHDFGAAAILVKLSSGRRALLLGQKSGVIHAVDPDRKGEILWQERVGKGGALGGIQWGPASDGQRVYVALSDVLVPGSTGGLFALNVNNGERIWQKPNEFCQGKPLCKAAQSAAVTAVPGAVLSGSLDGHIRAYAATTGAIIWDYDATHEFATVNGLKGVGGSFDAGGPVVAGGMLFTGSGYGSFGGIPGNVLLAFGPE